MRKWTGHTGIIRLMAVLFSLVESIRLSFFRVFRRSLIACLIYTPGTDVRHSRHGKEMIVSCW
jgi:hypothetical protein